MVGKNCFRKFISLTTAVAVLCVYSMVTLAVTPKDITADISVTGNVTVNGQSMVSNATLISGSTIVTAAGSSAVVGLGKNGRIEVLENSNLVLNFGASNIVGIISSGKVRVSNAAGVATTFTSKDATVIADASQANSFTIDVECAHTHVDTASGSVTVREGTTDRQVAAGSSVIAGNMAQTGCEPCLRPDSAPPVRVGGWPWLILLGAGIAGAAILFGKRNKTDSGGNVIIVSPVR
jgi:hypothetical protein